LLIWAALATLTSDFGWFVAAAVMLGVALRSFADAADVRLGDARDWTRGDGEPEHMTWSGAWVLAMTEALRRRSLASAAADTPPAILMLPPDLPS
jgi:hypothetical protein